MNLEAFKALRMTQNGPSTTAQITRLGIKDLDPGEVVIEAYFSSINYKDALGVTGKGRIYKKSPIIGGIDVAGKIISSSSSRWREGEEVLVTGTGLGEEHDGGYSQVVRVAAKDVVAVPRGLTMRDVMIYGTAGFTAAIAIHRLLVNDQQPEQGPIVVTGATGGVGMFAVTMLAQLGFEVIAVSGKEAMHGTLKKLGAKSVIHPDALQLGKRPLESVRFGGVIDNVGGELLSGLIRHTNLWGNIAVIGLAGGHDLHATVMPHILRGVSLLGISSNNTPMPLREVLWQRLATDLKPERLDDFVTETVTLEQVPSRCENMLNRQTHGRILVDLKK